MAKKMSCLRKLTLLLSLGLFFSGFALSAFAQEKEATTEATKWRRKPAFSLKFGAFFPNNSTTIRVDETAPGGTVPGTEIDLENELGLAKTATTIRLDADIRIASWFSLDLGYYGFRRGKSSVINSDIQVGDTLFPVYQTIKTEMTTAFWKAALKFYFIHRPRVDFGVYIGAYANHFGFQIRAEEIDRTLLETRKFWAPIPSAGLHFSYTIIPNLYLYGGAGYFYYEAEKIKVNSLALNISLDYYFWKFLGIGARYDFAGDKIELHNRRMNGLIDYTISGFQVYAIIGF